MTSENYELDNAMKKLKQIADWKDYQNSEAKNNDAAEAPSSHYQIGNTLWDRPQIQYSAQNAESDSLLDHILSGDEAKETIAGLEELITKRESLKHQKIQEIEGEKDKVRPLLHFNTYSPAPQDNQVLQQYLLLNQMAVDEEIKCWKDVSLLHLKKLETQFGSLGYANGEDNEKS